MEEEEEEEILLVGGGDSKKRSTTSKKNPSSEDSGDEVDGPPKRLAKKAKDSTPLNTFHAKVGQVKCKKAPRRRSRLHCAVITACVYVSSFFDTICTLSRVLFYAGVRLVPFFMFW